MTFDSKCYDLAEAFLSDEPNLFTEGKCNELAALLQQTIEDFIADRREHTPDPVSHVSWLRSAIDELKERGPTDDDEDPDAYWEMVAEVEALHRKLAMLQPSGE